MRRHWFVASLLPAFFLAACHDVPVGPAFRPLAQPIALSAATLVVDDDGHASASDCGAASVAASTIQAAVDAAASGDLVLVCPGNYDELVTVATNDLTIRAAGPGATVRPSSVAVNTNLLSGNPVRAIVLVDGATGVAVEGLTVDGSVADAGASLEVCGGGRPFYVGIFFRGGSGRVTDARVTNMRSASGCSFGVFTQSVLGVPVTLAVSGSTFDHYGSGGIVCTGPEASCAFEDNTLRGLGPVDNQLQTGIAVRFGAEASFAGNIVTDHSFTPNRLPGPAGGISAKSVGIFMIAASPNSNPHIMERNQFARNDMNVQRSLTEEVVF